MNAKQKAERTGIIFLVLLIVSGAALLYRGNDAVALGVAKKEGILTDQKDEGADRAARRADRGQERQSAGELPEGG